MASIVTFEEMSEKLTDYNERKFNVQDQLMVFFAGHGSFDEVLNEGALWWPVIRCATIKQKLPISRTLLSGTG